MSPLRSKNFLCAACATAALVLTSALLASAVLVQPYNYLLDDSPLTNQHDASGSLSPFYNDNQAGGEQASDKDIVSILGDGLARLRLGRMLAAAASEQDESSSASSSGLSAEMAELMQGEQQAAKEAAGEQSMAQLLMAGAQQQADEQEAQSEAQKEQPAQQMRGSIMELDTSQQQPSSGQLSKADLKQSAGPTQWYNPKETIPVLKISSMATPSKYKKVYFRSEKKLVDGAFHSPAGSDSTDSKKSTLVKSFGSSADVQRRSSRGSHSSAPPGVLQDGVIDFLKKFRDVYVQTRPAGAPVAASAASPLNNFASIVSAAASSPLASFLAPASGSSSSGTKPGALAGALSTAGQLVNSAAMLSQAAASPSTGSGAAAGSAAAAAAGAAASGPNKSPLSAQSYVSFWSKTFPTWVRKMLKQMRRRSLYNSSKRQQHHAHQHAAGQKLAHGGVAGAVDSSASSASSGSSSASSSSGSS